LYFVCENVDLGIKISGIIALVSLGLFMAAFGKTRISPESDHAVHTFWKYIVYACETTIFLIAGVLVGIKVVLGESTPGALPITGMDFVKLLMLYVCMTVVRFTAIAIFMPILKHKGYGMTWDDVRKIEI
jgi:NhaP-type Na+/H+ or K+/H+ antiporter